MIVNVTRRSALAGLATFVAFPVRAQPAPKGQPKQDSVEYAELERPAVFEITTATGNSRETAQKGQG